MGVSIIKPFKYLLFSILFVGLLVGCYHVFSPVIADCDQFTKTRDEYRRDNDHLRKQISELRTKQNKFMNDPEYVEIVAREENLVRKNEVVYDFSKDAR